MAWIEQISDADATGVLAKIYAGGRERSGDVANIVRVMSLRPKELNTFLNLYLQLMVGESTLPRAERELLATVTSVANGCFY